MKRINSIYRIFVLFLIIIVGSFLILYWYSSANLKVSLQRVAKIQMEYSFDQLDQKVKEIELEASAVLASEDMKLLQVAIVDQEDIYSYVMKVKTMQQIFQEKQKTNSGMAEFVLYWPDEKRIVSSSTISGIKDKSVLSELEDNRWIISEGEIYFCRCYKQHGHQMMMNLTYSYAWSVIGYIASKIWLLDLTGEVHFVCMTISRVCFQLILKVHRFRVR